MSTPPDPEHGIEGEPHLNPAAAEGHGQPAQDPSELAADAVLGHEATRTDLAEQAARHSIHNEPAIFPGTTRSGAGTTAEPARTITRDWSCFGCRYNLRGLSIGQPCPECGRVPRYLPPPEGVAAYGNWLKDKWWSTSNATRWSTVLFTALGGGVWAVIGTLLSANFGALGIVVIGPVTEEVMKIAIVTGTIETHPYLFRSPAQIRIAALGSALVFAVIENLLYLNVYIDDPTTKLILWRWIICTGLHVGCTAIAVNGVVKIWQRSINELREPHLRPAGRALAAAIILHGGYNALAVILATSGFDF